MRWNITRRVYQKSEHFVLSQLLQILKNCHFIIILSCCVELTIEICFMLQSYLSVMCTTQHLELKFGLVKRLYRINLFLFCWVSATRLILFRWMKGCFFPHTAQIGLNAANACSSLCILNWSKVDFISFVLMFWFKSVICCFKSCITLLLSKDVVNFKCLSCCRAVWMPSGLTAVAACPFPLWRKRGQAGCEVTVCLKETCQTNWTKVTQCWRLCSLRSKYNSLKFNDSEMYPLINVKSHTGLRFTSICHITVCKHSQFENEQLITSTYKWTGGVTNTNSMKITGVNNKNDIDHSAASVPGSCLFMLVYSHGLLGHVKTS